MAPKEEYKAAPGSKSEKNKPSASPLSSRMSASPPPCHQIHAVSDTFPSNLTQRVEPQRFDLYGPSVAYRSAYNALTHAAATP